ncbi:hypothetical protein [Flavobacterium chilense]|uniref:Uncharacterized protein n=1 Tax=Flavobacterium chilense TaxID=946677 RepID=A0A1M7C5F3_9FLAO|nr:hypothetical protein [Flavobacterium chilense]SHL62397.1 hypothetical protein SAMN05444484_10227 [Flavobacterium chilense]
MNYYTYWSISELPSNTRSFDVFFWVAIGSLVFWILIKKFKRKNNDYEKLILLWTTGVVFSLSAVMFFYLKLYTTDTTEKRIQNLFNSPNVFVIEGKITDFKREEQVKKMATITWESFMVDSIQFRYNDVLLGRFNHFGETRNRVFKNDLPIRITYAKENHEILKIEIAR